MLPFRSYSRQEHQANPEWIINGGDSVESSASKVERKASADVSKSHRDAERRRRQRINSHLSTLRTLLPNTAKADKASLLAEVVHQVRELRRQFADVVTKQDVDEADEGCTSSDSSTGSWPGERDEATLSFCNAEGSRLVKATVCCEDRPGLNQDLSRAIGLVRARLVRAEMMTVGGRSKSVVVMEMECAGERGDGYDDMGTLKRALNDVVENGASFYRLGPAVRGSKRARTDNAWVSHCGQEDASLVGSSV